MNWSEEDLMNFLERKGQVTAKSKPKKSKYNNKKTWIDGLCFDSKKEGDYYNQLKLLLKVNAIRGFCLQPQFVIVEGDETDRAITYKADETFEMIGDQLSLF